MKCFNPTLDLFIYNARVIELSQAMSLFIILTWRITVLIKALTDGVNIWLVPWKHQRTMPPLLKMVNKSNIVKNKNTFDKLTATGGRQH